MAEAISIFVGALGFFSALAAGETLASLFPSFAVVSAVGVDEIGVEAFLIGPAALDDAVATACGVVVALTCVTGFRSVVALGSSVAVVLAFMMSARVVKEPL